MTEEWRDVLGYEGIYMVSSLGRVKALNFHNYGYEKIMALSLVRDYYGLTLTKNKVRKMLKVHRIVWEAFNGPIPEGMQVNHINEDKLDNRLENLSLMSPKENINWGTCIKRRSKKQLNRTDLSKPVIQYSLEGKYVADYPSAKEAVRNNPGTDANHLRACCRGDKHYLTHKGFIWKYAE